MNENFTIEIEHEKFRDNYWLYITNKKTGETVAIRVAIYEYEMLEALGIYKIIENENRKH